MKLQLREDEVTAGGNPEEVVANAPLQDDGFYVVPESCRVMTELTSLTLAQARDGLRKRDFRAVELAEAYLAAMAKARSLNAYIVETPERALAMARESDLRLDRGGRATSGGDPPRHKGSFRDPRRAHTSVQPDLDRLQADL